MSRNLCITSADGQTGHLIAELILTDDAFTSKVKSVTCLSLHPEKCNDLEDLGAVIVPYKPGNAAGLVQSLKESGADTILLIPPAHKQKVKLAEEMILATREAGVLNTVLLSSAGADLAERDDQPRMREFIDIEARFMETKGLSETSAATSPCIIRAGFYAENLLLYNKDVQKNGKLRLPVGEQHSFAPVALGDIATIAAYVLTSEGPKGLSDQVRGQLITITGPQLVNGPELASNAQKAGLKLEFEDISEKQAIEILEADAEIDESEMQYLLEYYSLVRAGKTNYISTHSFHDITGSHPTEMLQFFQTYDAEFKPKRRRLRK
ncbi:uncharacterized protein C8Q71DRAFT_732941 [Rhodofomes roseus]|uniref:NmrA-like domain-containing protein n=1 Tax=Rhodofomes roseus TaxID=34475 RepID=A0ABQ8KVY3_9APHY|nr:uncharacterized protein C8Q71DRAFT_732941 [Rhodofomes roseus]KAH9842455.1 hypothetical protein C8Q71DRAFT_732941 [Rhodofomes roseus]